MFRFIVVLALIILFLFVLDFEERIELLEEQANITQCLE